jgi:hypothetical protein
MKQRVNNEGRTQHQFRRVTKRTSNHYVRICKRFPTYAMRVAIYQTGGPEAGEFPRPPLVTLTTEQLDTITTVIETTDHEELESGMLALVDYLLRVKLKG